MRICVSEKGTQSACTLENRRLGYAKCNHLEFPILNALPQYLFALHVIGLSSLCTTQAYSVHSCPHICILWLSCDYDSPRLTNGHTVDHDVVA